VREGGLEPSGLIEAYIYGSIFDKYEYRDLSGQKQIVIVRTGSVTA